MMSNANRRTVHKNFRLDPVQIARAKKALGTSTETETIVRALDIVITEDRRNRLVLEANQRLLKSGIQIRDVFGGSEE
jgi:predicted nucleic acid-binding protein